MVTRLPTTLIEAIRYFSDFENCETFLVDLRWPDGKVACPQCGSEKAYQIQVNSKGIAYFTDYSGNYIIRRCPDSC
jgi:Transposase zinc-ribbon domain